MAKFCPGCGNEVNDFAAFCNKCGAPLPVEQAAVPIQPNEQINPMQQVPQQVKSSKASIVLGILGIVISWFIAVAGHALSITGIALGLKEYKATGKITGLVLSIIGEVCSIASSVIGAIMLSGAF